MREFEAIMPETRGQAAVGAKSNDLFIPFGDVLVCFSFLPGIVYDNWAVSRPGRVLTVFRIMLGPDYA
jgi:uncharacterized membrane protein YqaE (UPF0057 family)